MQTRKLVGMVTDRDLALRMVAEERDTKTTKAEEVMSRKMVTCHAEDDVLRRIPPRA